MSVPLRSSMKLSVVIVNYNVEYFLEQCLHSVMKAMEGIEGEVWVVDNASVDGSVAMVRERFPSVKLIENRENLGFSKANDQAIERSTGEFVLLLNPDTVVEEDTFQRTLAFMDDHPEAGGLGVKMLDGKGRFLPESKRALPTPSVAFYKIFGLSALFPRSKRFGRYHLGYLAPDQVHEVEVLSGAFMLLRRSALEKVGYLDTSFFMYGEDIDLSYRLIQGGYKNYYYPHTRIIHYKGESTKKSSINYVVVFYKAMLIFADKHFSSKNRQLFRSLIHSAIYFRAFLAILSRATKKIALPFFDALLIFGGALAIQKGYELQTGIEHPDHLVWGALLSYTAVWMLSVLFSGGYDPPVRKRHLVRGLIVGTLLILVGYSLLPESYRFSRAILLFSALWTAFVYLSSRRILEVAKASEGGKARKVALVGEPDEGARISKLLKRTREEVEVLGFISPDPEQGYDRERSILGNIERIPELIDVHGIEELIFAARDVPAQRMIDLMSGVENRVEYKVAPPESMYIIGSRSIDHSGDLHTVDINSVARPENRRNKRVVDLLLSLLLSLLSPFLVFLMKRKKGFFRNILRVMKGKRTWVGYVPMKGSDPHEELPWVPPGVLHPMTGTPEEEREPEMARKMNVLYAKDYRVRTDLQFLIKGLRELGTER